MLSESKWTPSTVLTRADFPRLIEALRDRGYQVLGPTVQDQAIVYDELERVEDLPIGWTDEQEAGRYRLKKREDQALFGYTIGPQSWKKFLFPPRQVLFRARRNGSGFEIEPTQEAVPRQAFLGVRACEVHALRLQDRVFLQGPYRDPVYAQRREQSLVVAVQCGQAGRTCFCASMRTGPQVGEGADLVLTEVIDGPAHYFVAGTGSALGRELLESLPHQPAEESHQAAAEQAVRQAARQMGRQLDTQNLPALFRDHFEHRRWDEVSRRCLSCANCTMVCPTCFCSTVEDVTDLSGQTAERRRVWDSCFTVGFTHVAGGSVRTSVKSRYRQWLTHKLSTWIDQFGEPGCVGCGRCITWCPVGIDLTEEARAIQQSTPMGKETPDENA